MDKQENDEEAMNLNPAPVDGKDRYGIGTYMVYNNKMIMFVQLLRCGGG